MPLTRVALKLYGRTLRTKVDLIQLIDNSPAVSFTIETFTTDLMKKLASSNQLTYSILSVLITDNQLDLLVQQYLTLPAESKHQHSPTNRMRSTAKSSMLKATPTKSVDIENGDKNTDDEKQNIHVWTSNTN